MTTPNLSGYANEPGESTGVCPFCGGSYPFDLDSYSNDLARHEKVCPQVEEWERCKE